MLESALSDKRDHVQPWARSGVCCFSLLSFFILLLTLLIVHIFGSGFVEGDSPYATSGQKGTYYFEFSRPLRTMDRLQQVWNSDFLNTHTQVLCIIEFR